jgi:hypothetical protein
VSQQIAKGTWEDKTFESQFDFIVSPKTLYRGKLACNKSAIKKNLEFDLIIEVATT